MGAEMVAEQTELRGSAMQTDARVGNALAWGEEAAGVDQLRGRAIPCGGQPRGCGDDCSGYIGCPTASDLDR